MAILMIALTGLTCGGVAAYPDEPPLGHSGGFSEPDCSLCHQQFEAPPESGALELHGVPARAEPEKRYALTVTLEHPDLARAGFQLSVRRCDGGEAAGDFSDFDDRVVVTPPWAKSAAYAWQSEAGTVPQTPMLAQWMLFWFAPEDVAGGFEFAVAANAANGDDSALGDTVYVQSAGTADCEAAVRR